MTFSIDLAKFAEKAKGNMETVVRVSVIEIGNKIIDRSPVGDATAWKNPPPAGYVGGRFRGNWQYGFNSAPSGDFDTIDKSGDVSRQRIQVGITSNPVVGIHYLTNNLPYAQRLEDGYSKQAPSGMVGLTAIEAPGIVEAAARAVNK